MYSIYRICLVVLAIVSLVVFSSDNKQTQAAGEVAAYSFSEVTGSTTQDHSGNSNTGTLINSPTWTSAGKYGNGLSFDGSNDYVSLGNSSSLNPTSALTLSAWVNLNLVSSQGVVMKYGSQHQYQLRILNRNIRFGVTTNTGTTDLTTTTDPVAPNVWTHIAGTYDGSQLAIYANGVQIASMSKTGTIVSTSMNVEIGRKGDGFSYASGVIDEVRIYSRALSQSEIQTDMNNAINPTNPTPPPPPPVNPPPPPASGLVPSISSVSGTVAQGNILSINGSALNQENMRGWLPFFTANTNRSSFEGTNGTKVSTLGYGTGGDGGDITSSRALLGNTSAYFRSTVSNPNCIQGIGQDYNNASFSAPDNNDFWFRTYVQFNSPTNWSNNFQKWIETPFGTFYIQPENGTPAGQNPLRFILYEGQGGVTIPFSLPGGQLMENRWYVFEWHAKRTSPTVFDLWVDGQQVLSHTPNVNTTNQTLMLFGLINACGTASWDTEAWMDGMVLSTQRAYPSAVVEIGNSANYSTATKRYQEPISISDSKIDFKLDLTGLGSGPYYLFVTNNIRQTSMAIQLNTGSVTPPPPPPTGGLTPSISSVSGSLGNGNTITVNGASLIAEDLVNTGSFFTDPSFGPKRQGMEGNDGQDIQSISGGYPSGWTEPGDTIPSPEDAIGSNGYIDSAQKVRGNTSAKFHSIENTPGVTSDGYGQSYNAALSLGNLGNPQEYWGRAYVMFDNGQFPNDWWKLFYSLYAPYYIDLDGPPSGSMPSHFILSYPSSVGVTHTDKYVTILPDGATLSPYRWYCFEWHFKSPSSSAVADGRFEIYANGLLRHSGASWHPFTNNGNISSLLIGTVNAGSSIPYDFKTWIDDVLIRTGNNRVHCSSKIELADSPNYATANKRWQAPISLADGQIQFSYDDTGLIGTNRYVFITNHSQQISAPYALTGSSTPPPPSTISKNVSLSLEGRANSTISGTLEVLNSSKSLIKSYPFTSNSSGTASLNLDQTSGTLFFKLKASPFLSRLLSGDINTNLTFPILRTGDINQDNIVNSIDFSTLNTNWFTSQQTSDLNRDGLVNSLDFSLMNKNWFQTGEQ